MNLCANHQILLWNVCPVQKGYEANLCVNDFFLLKPLASKCRTRVRVRRKYGLPFFLKRHRKRKVFALGLCFCGFFIFFLSCFIWNISIEGNLSISRQTMMEYLTQQNVNYGTWKKTVDCKQLAADLRNEFPNLIWVSVRLNGTYLSIQVQENSDLLKESEPELSDSDLVADENGIIVSMITREGTPVVGEGDTVSVGDMLVKGELEITDDSDSVVAYHYTAADADIYIQTEITYKDSFSMAHEVIRYTGRNRYGLYLNLFGRYFGLDMGTNSFEKADILGEEHQLCLMNDFYLPVSAGILQSREYKTIVETYEEEEAISIAEAKLQKFLSENEEKGVQIFENNVKISVSANVCHAEGTLTVIKKTGKRMRAQKSNLPQEGTDE